MACKKVFLDTNILLDYLVDRGDFSVNAEKIFERCVSGEIECLIAPHSVLNIFYILRKYYTTSSRKLMLASLCSLCKVCPINTNIVDAALADSAEDIEDYVQLLCAQQASAHYLITRDPSGFQGSSIPVLSPAEFLQLNFDGA